VKETNMFKYWAKELPEWLMMTISFAILVVIVFLAIAFPKIAIAIGLFALVFLIAVLLLAILVSITEIIRSILFG